MYNPTNGVLEYMETLSPASAESAGPMQFRISPVMPRVRRNPRLDFMKLLFMLGGAVAAALIYDRFVKYHSVTEFEMDEILPLSYNPDEDYFDEENSFD